MDELQDKPSTAKDDKAEAKLLFMAIEDILIDLRDVTQKSSKQDILRAVRGAIAFGESVLRQHYDIFDK